MLPNNELAFEIPVVKSGHGISVNMSQYRYTTTTDSPSSIYKYLKSLNVFPTYQGNESGAS